MKKLISLLLLISLTINPLLAQDLGNTVPQDEYPDSNMVEPCTDKNDSFMIEGGVSKYIDVSLEDCLKFAMGNNPRIQAAMQDVFASDYRIKQAWSNWFPTISWQTGYTRIKQLQLSDVFDRNLIFNYYVLGTISVSQMLYDFGVTQNQVTIRKLDNQGYKITLTATINDVLCDVKKAYFNLLYAYEKKRVAEDTLEKFDLFYNQAKAFYTAGLKPKVDVTIAEVNLSNAKLSLIQAENAIDTAIAQLNNTLGLPYVNRYNVQEKLAYAPCSVNLDNLVETAKDARPEFKLADVRVESARQSVKLVKKSYFPQLSIEGQYQVGGRTFVSNYGYNFGGYLNFPTVNGMLIKNEIKEAKALHNKEIANAENTKNSIVLEIQNAFYDLKEKKSQLPVAYLSVKQAKENYELSYGRYRVGVGNPTELKDAQVTYQNNLLNYYAALYAFNTSKANLEKSIGKNIVDGEIEKDYVFDDESLYGFLYSDIVNEFDKVQTDEYLVPVNNTDKSEASQSNCESALTSEVNK